MAAIKFGVSPSMQCTINVRLRMLARQILAKKRNSPNIIARQNLLIYSMILYDVIWSDKVQNKCTLIQLTLHQPIMGPAKIVNFGRWKIK